MRFYDRPSRLYVMRRILAHAERQPTRRAYTLQRLRRLLARTIVLAGLPMLLAHADAQSKPAKIVTVAGNGTAGHVATQDGGPATRAELDEPYGTAVDHYGNLYIAERANHRIRRVDAITGIITTVAGNGTPGYRPTDEYAPAIASELNGPRAVAVDALGNLYIADTDNQRIRKIDPQGTMWTIAGNGIAGYRAHDEYGSALAAELDSPRAVAVDRFGNVFLSDYNNQRIRKIESTSRVIHTVAGTGTAGYLAAQGGGPAAEAEINDPDGIAVDTLGNLYIADTGNHRVRRVESHTGLITTVAGNGGTGYRASDEGKLATGAELNSPYGVAFDLQGNLYIADMEEHRIRRIDAATGVIITIAGSGVPGFIPSQDGEAASIARLNKPRGIAVDPVGNLYVADTANNRIRKVESAGSGVYVAVR